MDILISLRKKLLLIFGLLITIALTIEGIFALQIARKAVAEKIEAHLTDKAEDIAEIIDGRSAAFFQFLEGLARMPALQDQTLSFTQKAKLLLNESKYHEKIQYLGICDLQGNRYDADGGHSLINDRDWFQAALQGKNFIAEPRIAN